MVKATGGLSAARQFARYYALPGVGHCGGNGPDSYNGIGAVVAWSEKHVAPRALTATQYVPAPRSAPAPPSASDLTDAVPVLGAPSATAAVRQLEIYPYPKLPVYRGYGNVDAASSYTGKVSNALEKPVRWLGKFNAAMIWCNSKGTNCRETSGPV